MEEQWDDQPVESVSHLQGRKVIWQRDPEEDKRLAKKPKLLLNKEVKFTT